VLVSLEDVKVTIIGAGSLTFTPFLVKELMSSSLSKDCSLTVALMDVNPEILDLMYKVSREIVGALKGEGKVKVERCTDRRSALEGTNFVIVTANVGGVKAAHVDVEIPLGYGIRHAVGDTVGPAGIMRALRHVPVFLDIARDVEDLAPEAYLFNYSNPLTALTRVMARETKAKAYGLCTGIFGFRNGIADFLGASRESVELYIGGINHLYWATKLNIEGESLYPKIEEIIKGGVQIEGEGVIMLNFYKIYGLLPGPEDRHIAEFFPNLLLTEEAMEKYCIPKFPEGCTADYKTRKPFEELLSSVASGGKNVAELLGVKGMEEEGIGVVRLMESLALDKPMLYPGINVANKSCVGNLPSWSVVEVPAHIDSTGIHPVQVGDLPKAVAGFTTQRILQYEVTIDAALTGDRNLVLQALLLDGYVDDVETAEKLLKDMLQAERDLLPEYWFPGNATKTS